MTEVNEINVQNIKYMCRMCLKTNDYVFQMSSEEIDFYENIVKVQNVRKYMYICVYCAHLLRKCAKLIRQCQITNDLINSVLESNSKSVLCIPESVLAYNINTTKTIVHHYPLDDGGMDILNTHSENFSPDLDDEIFGDDDELPLVMLKNDDKVFVKEKQRKKKKRRIKNYQMLKVKTDAEIKQEIDDETKKYCDVQEKMNSKPKKVLREGFTSRMVQETEQYIVIKLTKEQVLKEMDEKSKSGNYILAPFKCEKCVKGFNFEDVLQTHMEKHSMERGTYLCEICMQYCPSVISLRGHIKSHTTRYKCKVCGDVRLSRQHLLEHHVINHTPNAVVSYRCDHCAFSTNKRTVIQRHVKTHASTERHACDKCGKLFKNIESLRVHTIRHDKSKRVECEHCQRKFIYPSMLQKHVQSVHVNKDYYCVECDVRFKSRENLKLHFKKAKRHRDSSSFRYPCPQCPQKFVTPSTLAVHLSSVHGAPKQHPCGLCTQVYSSKDTLRCHVNRVHREKQNNGVFCHVCSKKFSQKSVLRKHMRTHTGERPFACACGAAFAQGASLRAHAAARHKHQDQPLHNEMPHSIQNNDFKTTQDPKQYKDEIKEY